MIEESGPSFQISWFSKDAMGNYYLAIAYDFY